MRIREGDTIEVVAGNWTGERGEVQRVIHGRKGKGRYVGQRNPNGDRVIVSGINMRTKHQRATGQVQTQAGRIQLEGPIHVSNVVLVCPHCDQPTRVGITRTADNRRARTCRKCGQYVDSN